MAVHDLYSYRQRVSKGKIKDIFVYDEFPDSLRNQIIHIWGDAIGSFWGWNFGSRCSNTAWAFIHDAIAREHGLLDLGGGQNLKSDCEVYLHKTISVDMVLDIVEMSFHCICKVVPNFTDSQKKMFGIKDTANKAIEELNERFLRAGVGYQFDEGCIHRIDSELIHKEIVRPAYRHLNEQEFEGPRNEFLNAHKHYRAREFKDAITDANNAFESTLKTICDKQGWEYSQGSRASDLIRIVRDNGLFPGYLDKPFDQLLAALKSGLPTIRNEEGAHGQGASPRQTPEHIAAYALHLTAVNIQFLVKAHMEALNLKK